jgi:hypothetical protein
MGMIKKGDKRRAGDLGKYTVEEIIYLEKPEKVNTPERGEILYQYAIAQIKWEKDGSYNNWMPYYYTDTVGGKKQLARSAPMMSDNTLLELLQKAIKSNFFDDKFLKNLEKTISSKLNLK